ncbi:MAG: Serine protease [Candidatus Kaiserbacteria bacterium GW2011_GWA1_50_28]|uniref:Serine protease n=1 Tax=Candidatus Kaiserbacteria bacterium GW2011_GWA1_50_28 TaxID=1618668 RepID=A0A0G1ZEU3_9BACT|nr:MAG: Serine protease [Candidatus Kaiserbacteria bacterium GW2011_GWA1_50_28]
MGKTVRILAPALVCTTLLFVALFAHADLRAERGVAREERIPGQYIVVFKDFPAGQNAAEQAVGAEDIEKDILSRTRGERLHSYRSAINGFSARLSPSELDAIKSDPRVAFISEDRVVSIDVTSRERDVAIFSANARDRWPMSAAEQSTPTISSQTLPTGIDRINAETSANKGAGIHVAVIDTGIQKSHPDLAGNIAGGKNCSSGTSYNDGNGHGTHVAGTIAGINNDVGVVGVAPEAKLWAVRVLDNAGNGTWSSVICGLDFVTSKAPANGGPIQVANMSLSGGGVSDNNCGNSNKDALHKAVCRARDAGVTIVVAAGNSAADSSTQVPAAYDDAVITVSALVDSDGAPDGKGAGTYYGPDDTFATFSNFGNVVDVGAPGVSIYSTWINNGYSTISGTSMASPHVAGAAALYLSAFPNAVWTKVRNAIVSTGEERWQGHSDPSGKHPEPVVRVDNLAALWSFVNNPPTANAGLDQSGFVGDVIQFDGSGSFDSDGTISSYAWDFGDGATQNGVSVSHIYSTAGTYTAVLIVEDNGGQTASDSATITIIDVSPTVGFSDSFENGLGNWTQDLQSDWRISSQRSTDGTYSIKVKGQAADASIESGTIDLGGSTSAVIEFDWFIKRNLDKGEYIAFDISKDGGSSWKENRTLQGNVDSEDTWHSERMVVIGISSLKIRFRGTMSSSEEGAYVDNVRVVAQ